MWPLFYFGILDRMNGGYQFLAVILNFFAPSCFRNRTVPLGPIGTVPAAGVNLGPSKRGATS